MTESRPALLSRGASGVLTGWLVTRALALGALATIASAATGDVGYYREQLDAIGVDGLASTLVEYPVPALWIMQALGAVGDSTQAMRGAVAVLMALADLALTWFLFRRAGHRDAAVDLWLLVGMFLGPLLLVRFDVLPAVVAGAAVVVLARRPAVAGALLAVGTGLKVWPAALALLAAAPRVGRTRVLAAGAGVGSALAALSIAYVAVDADLRTGVDRLFSPLTWQSDRGLQIESIWATPLMIGRMVAPDTWVAEFSDFNAWEVLGPGVDAMLLLSSIATAAALVVAVLLAVRVARSGAGPEAVAVASLAVVCLLVVGGKTFSPQYLLWVGAVAAAVLSVGPHLLDARRRLAVVLTAALTIGVFPLAYPALVDLHGHLGVVLASVLLVARNLLVVGLTVVLVRDAWRLSGQTESVTSR